MLSSFRRRVGLACALTWLWVGGAHAFILSDPNFEPWLSAASGARSGNGTPVTLTWSIVGDGTSTPSTTSAIPRVGSDLISFLDTTYGGNPAGSNANDLTARPWFDLFQQSFDRWEQLSGIDYVYEPNDDNASLGVFGGQVGTRGDFRIGGRDIDGANGTLAFAYLPNGSGASGDVVFDTSDTNFYGNPNGNFLAFRNTLMHEVGHGLGLEHVVSSTDGLLLEPTIGLGFDGPQLDEVRAVHFFYGDVYEKSNNGLGNGTATRATDLGLLAPGSTTSIGADANVPTQFIGASDIDFVSVSNLDDADFFSFSITEPSFLDAVLTPLGGTFTQAGEGGTPSLFDASARSDLTLTIVDSNGITPLATLDNTGLGEIEAIQDFALLDAGEYFARVTGAQDTIQLYQLDLAADPIVFADADFNEDFQVDNQDLTLLQASLGVNAGGDADGDGDTDGTDFLIWQQQFNALVAPGDGAFAAVPEPTTAALLFAGLTIYSGAIKRRRPVGLN